MLAATAGHGPAAVALVESGADFKAMDAAGVCVCVRGASNIRCWRLSQEKKENHMQGSSLDAR